jgi:hypothetical protein
MCPRLRQPTRRGPVLRCWLSQSPPDAALTTAVSCFTGPSEMTMSCDRESPAAAEYYGTQDVFGEMDAVTWERHEG